MRNVNGGLVEVKAWMNDYIPDKTMGVIIYTSTKYNKYIMNDIYRIHKMSGV